ncbi:MAG: hypothetical protein HQK91_01260 [Nitrospirae bacterium]|nr:hypothetical protein [Nitrospirota bacterium]
MSQCDSPHVYGGISKPKMEEIILELKNNGCSITGANPWNVDVHQFGIKLKGTWSGDTGKNLTVEVTDKSFLVPCSMIWDKIDPIMKHINGLSEDYIAELKNKREESLNFS